MEEKEGKLTDKLGKWETDFRFFPEEKVLHVWQIEWEHQHRRKYQKAINPQRQKQKHVHEHPLPNPKEGGLTLGGTREVYDGQGNLPLANQKTHQKFAQQQKPKI